MNGISNKVSLTEGNIQNIDDENVTVAVSTDVPKELNKVEKDDKQSFEEFKTLYKDVITMKCKQDFGDCEDQKLWEDAAKELFLQSKNYILDGEEFKSKEDLQKEPEKEKKTENVIVTPQVIKENNENEFDDIKPGDEFVNEAGSKIVMLEPTETDEYNFKIINTNTNEEGTGKFSCTFMRDLLKDNHYKKVKSSELSESINNEPKDKLNATEFVSLVDNLKKMDLWDGKDETFKDAVEKYYSILDTQSKLKNEGTILSEEQLKEEADSPEFKYQLLDRLKSDCEYFLKAGNRNEKHLWAGNVDDQIAKMKELWNSLEEKPEWLSMEDIENYEKEMKQDIVEEAYDISYHLAQYDKVLRGDNDTYCVKVENRTAQTETKWLLVDKAYVEKMKELEYNYKKEVDEDNKIEENYRVHWTYIDKKDNKHSTSKGHFLTIEEAQAFANELKKKPISQQGPVDEPEIKTESKSLEEKRKLSQAEIDQLRKNMKQVLKDHGKFKDEDALERYIDEFMPMWIEMQQNLGTSLTKESIEEKPTLEDDWDDEGHDNLNEERLGNKTFTDQDEAEYYRNKELYDNSGLARHRDAMEKAKKACKAKGIEVDETRGVYESKRLKENITNNGRTKGKTTLEEDKFFNLYQSFNNLYGINKMNPSELIEFINDLKKMNRISDKDFDVMNDYANKWQDLINKTGYESNIVNESKEVKTEDQYEAERRKGRPNLDKIAKEVFEYDDYYINVVDNYKDEWDFVKDNVAEVAAEYNLREQAAEAVMRKIYKMAKVEYFKNKYSKDFKAWKEANPQTSDEEIVDILKAKQYNGEL